MSDFQPYNNPNQNNQNPNLNQGGGYQPNPNYQPPQQPYNPNQFTQQPQQYYNGGGNLQPPKNNNRTLMYVLLTVGVLALIPIIGLLTGGGSNNASATSASSRVSSKSSSSKSSSSSKDTGSEMADSQNSDSASSSSNSPSAGTAVFASGTLYSFAVSNGTTVDAVIALNPGLTVDNYSAYYGQALRIQ